MNVSPSLPPSDPAVRSPPQRRDGCDNHRQERHRGRSALEANDLLSGAEATLFNEAHTLRRLQFFYEQHTFDTQGPYADLFAVLLSTCKHMLDINTELVQHVRVHEAALRRQQATCDVMCGEVAHDKQHIKTLGAALARMAPDALKAREKLPEGDAPVQRDFKPDIRRSKSYDRHADEVSVDDSSRSLSTSTSTTTSQPSAHHPEIEQRNRELPPQHLRAWVHDVDRRLDTLQQQMTALHAAWSRQASPPRDVPSLTSPAALVDSRVTEATDTTELHEKKAGQPAVDPSLHTWKQDIERQMTAKLHRLALHIAALEKKTQHQQHFARWMERGRDDDGDDDANGTNAESADLSALPLMDQTDIAQGTSFSSPSSSPSPCASRPPAALTRWLQAQLHAWEGEWKQVLDDVQDAILENAGTPNGAVRPRVPAPSTHENRSESEESGGGLLTASLKPNSSSVRIHDREGFVQTIQHLLTLRKGDIRTVSSSSSSSSPQPTIHTLHRLDDELADLRARLEVLEVYAPHHHAIAARPPILGVELEDVTAPRTGVRLRTVYHGYLADRAGLSVGDVVVGVGCASVQTRAHLYVVLAELTRDFNAQCRVQIEAGFMRHFLAGPSVQRTNVDASILTELEDAWCADTQHQEDEAEEEDSADAFALEHALQRARAEAARINRRSGGSCANGTRTTSRSGVRPFATTAVRSAEHKELLTQCLPFFELCLHVVRDGRLRDVTLLVPPSDALRSLPEY